MQPEDSVEVRLWVALSLNFLACNTGWWPVIIHNLLQLLSRSFLSGRVPTGNRGNTQEQSKEAFFTQEFIPHLKGQGRTLQQRWSRPDPKGPRGERVPEHGRKRSVEHSTLGTQETGSVSQLTL